MGSDMCKARLRLKPSNSMAINLTLLTYVLLVLLVSIVSTQLTYQRACDCEYVVNGKCAYTLLLPTGSNEGSCPSSGSETIDSFMRNMTNRVNNLYDIAVNQSLLLNHVQDSIISLMWTNQPSLLNDSTWRQQQEATLALLNATLQSGAKEVDQLKTTTEMLARNLTNLTGLFQLQMSELSNLQSVVNETKEALEKRTADDPGKISQLTDTVKLLRQVSCSRRAALFSGPDRLNGTSIMLSSSFNNDSAGYGPHQLALDNVGSPGAWCPQEPPQNAWVQFDIGRTVLVFGIATRGRNDVSQWITTYNIQYVPSNSSGVLPNNITLDWVYFKDVVGANQVFQGNTDQASIQLNMLWTPIVTRYVRLLPLTGFNGGNVCTRADIIGCVDNF